MKNKSNDEFFSNTLKNNYCRYANTDLNDYINNVAEQKEIPRVQCNHIGKNGKQCITLLNSFTQEKGLKVCNLHNSLAIAEDYSIKDSLWKCNATITYHENKKWVNVICNEPCEEKTIVGDNTFYRCPKHSMKIED